jgi:hypothetical protein
VIPSIGTSSIERVFTIGLYTPLGTYLRVLPVRRISLTYERSSSYIKLNYKHRLTIS